MAQSIDASILCSAVQKPLQTQSSVFFVEGFFTGIIIQHPHKLVDVARVKQFSMIISREQLYMLCHHYYTI